MAKIVSFRELEEQDMFDLEVEHPDHQYYLANGVLTSNSHALCYSIISYQCAYLLTYCPDQWIASYLNKETADPKKREKALGVAKSLGYKIDPADINESERVWRVAEDKEKTLIEPFLNVKGLGEKAIDEIYKARPFETIEEVLFNENISYRAFNKKSIDALCRSGAMKSLQDERFFGDKHFWKAVADDKPKTPKKLAENIEKYKNEGSFSRNEMISFSLELSGQFPISLVLTEKTRNTLTKRGVYGITETTKSGCCWFILMREEVKTTKTGKGYLVLHVIDDSGKDKKIKCWGTTHSDILIPNHAYLANLDFDDKYGFSVRGIKKNFRLIK